MGVNKLWLPYRGKPIIEAVIAKAKEANLQGVYVVISEVDHALNRLVKRYGCQAVTLNCSRKGIGYSLASAIRRLPMQAQAAMVLLADQPQIHVQDMSGIKQQFKTWRMRITEDEPCIIQTRYRRGEEGHPTLFSSHFFSELAMLKGDIGAKKLIGQYSCHVQLHISNHLYPPDVDTTTDYLRLITDIGGMKP
ncbi:hypothetical protein BEP19_03950 [Ammoniphilus oxalaticus]|uniref:MobA-like NTP transferase domain-containing protein n=2 Tax=Ammoniphilus oxalaticus TaxID=66863 RepID=A0A419SLQ9_9BACL|nr:hypothetical protein BEP19_03950 [Ammoniphilus oxalaticus]